MTDINANVCRICMKKCNNIDVSDHTSYIGFLTEILGIKNCQTTLRLCTWCKASLNRTKELLEMAAESEKVFAKHNPPNVYITLDRQLYRFSFHHNMHIDIPPVKNPEVNIHNDDNEHTNIKKETEEPCVATNKIIEETNMQIDKLVIPLNRKEKKCKNVNYDEMKFEANILSFEEQMKEIDEKRTRDKYKKMKFQCHYCGIGFLTEDVFQEHNYRHSQTAGAHECKICRLRFKTPDVLSQHTLAHKRRFTCLICEAMFKRWSHCIAHRYKCGTVASPATCTFCMKMFSNDHSLDVHIKAVHKTENKYACAHCDKRFASKQRLNVHTRSHTGQKPFACEQCSRTFSTNSNLRAHSSVHEHVKQHYCVECNTFYKTEKSLKRHFSESARHLNINEMTYSCMDCSKQFSTEKLLNNHINVRHSSSYRCNHCNKTFSNKTNLNKHVRCIHAPPI